MRGAFHLGLLSTLRESPVEVTAITGTSAGAIAACLFALDMSLDPEPVVEALKRTTWKGRPLSPLTLYRRTKSLINALRKPALLMGSSHREGLKEIFGDRRLEDAKIPLALLAADLYTGDPVPLREGEVVDALMASTAVPGLLPPKNLGGRYLVDGDVAEKVPVTPLLKLGRGQVVAVDISNPPPKPEPPSNALKTLILASEASRQQLKQMALKKAHRVITIPLEKPVGTFEVEKASELFELGKRSGEELVRELTRPRVFPRWWRKGKNP